MKQKYHQIVENLGIEISTGSIAKQANGSVTIQLGETTVFVSACAAPNLRPGQDFFPLTVDYREKYAAAGRFPGGFIKREGRPSEKETLTCRLCDRPLRPLFPKGFMNEVQVIGMLLAADMENESDILMLNGASAALMISDIPWNGPIGAIRLGEIDGEFVVNPTIEQIFESTLDLIYVGNEKEMMMIEGSADQMPEERFVEALEFSQEAIQPIINAQKKLAEEVAKPKKSFSLHTVEEDILSRCRNLAGDRLAEAVTIADKQERQDAVDVLQKEAEEKLKTEIGEESFDPDQVRMAFEELQEELFRKNVLDKQIRMDGRGPEDLRTITSEVNTLPRIHGSSLFTRGETQGLVLATLGTSRDTQGLDAVTGGATSKSFLLHYNFPPYSVGECGRTGTPGRREIGHGALAERSLLPVIPPEEECPYSIRLVSEIMESNGSTSMASICGGTLALMDAGVPILAPVAGISSGLVTARDESGNISRYNLLTDILGAEDHFGDMDFKIAGTREGITGFQLDLKIQGIPMNIAKEAIQQCRNARLRILDIMQECIAEPRKEVKEGAPRIHQIDIDPEKIGALIGPGGKNIKRITEITGAQIDIDENDSGRVSIFATSKDVMDRALEEVEMVTAEIEIDKTYKSIVRSVKEFGAFVECLPGKEGLVHISELSDSRVEKTEDVCQLGDELQVKCVGIDDKGRARLSRRAVICDEQGIPYEPNPRREGGGDRGDRKGGPRKGGKGPGGGGRGGRSGGGRSNDRGGGKPQYQDQEG